MTVSRFLLIASVVCFAIACLTAVGVVTSDAQAWTDGGLLSFAASFAV